MTSINENIGKGQTVFTLGLVDDGIGKVNYRMTSVSNGGLEQYELVGKTEQDKKKIRYAMKIR